MKKEIVIALCSTLLVLGGCAKKTEKSETSVTSKPKASAKTSESTEPSESAEAVESTEPVSTGTPQPTEKAAVVNTPQPAQQSTPASSDPTGTYQIISYDNGSGKQTFTPGKDTSIMGSSSIVLNQDGSCEFNLPGMSSEGCNWKGTEINTSGAQVTYSLNGNEMTVQDAGGTYVFRKK